MTKGEAFAETRDPVWLKTWVKWAKNAEVIHAA